MVNVKKKGNKWENVLANWLTDHGFRSFKDGQSGGGTREKGDVVNSLDMTIESKATKKIELPAWWRQVTDSALKHGNQPVLFIHQDGMRDKEWLVVMHSNDWIEMLKASREEKEVVYEAREDDRERRYKLDNAIRACKDVVKILDV